MDIREIIDKSLEKVKSFDPEIIVKELMINDFLSVEHGIRDVRDKDECTNYCWFPGFIELLKPKMIVELGSAMGVALVAMLQSPYKDFTLYGTTLEEHGLEFCYVDKKKYPNLTCITENYMDLGIWPKDVDLGKTDLFYIDGLHKGPHVTEQLLLYKPFFKSGAIIAFDDIFMSPDMAAMWHGLDDILDISYKTELPLHFTGWGLIQIGGKNV